MTDSSAVAYLEAALDQADDERSRQLIREAIQLETADVQEGSA